jgi:hypothetical protein
MMNCAAAGVASRERQSLSILNAAVRYVLHSERARRCVDKVCVLHPTVSVADFDCPSSILAEQFDCSGVRVLRESKNLRRWAR